MENNGRLLFNIDNLQVSIIVEKYNKFLLVKILYYLKIFF